MKTSLVSAAIVLALAALGGCSSDAPSSPDASALVEDAGEDAGEDASGGEDAGGEDSGTPGEDASTGEDAGEGDDASIADDAGEDAGESGEDASVVETDGGENEDASIIGEDAGEEEDASTGEDAGEGDDASIADDAGGDAGESGEDASVIETDGGVDAGVDAGGDAGGPVELTRTTPLPADDTCEWGGVLVEKGLDLDGDGVLSADEVTSSAKECCTVAEADKAAACQEGTCGEVAVADSCGASHALDCGACASGADCLDNTCCEVPEGAEEQACAAVECGKAKYQDACGRSYNTSVCAYCDKGFSCQSNACQCAHTPVNKEKACRGYSCGQVTVTALCEPDKTLTYDCGSPCGDGMVCRSDTHTCCTPLTEDEAKALYCGAFPTFWECGGDRQVDDHCGGTMTVNCGDSAHCPEGTACDEDEASGSFLQCVIPGCTPAAETDEEVCSRLGVNCGHVVLTDTCMAKRVVEDCGQCPAPKSCDQETHVCGCTPITCEEQGISCGEAYDGCGHFVTCGPACEGETRETTRIRLLAGNITSGVNQSYDEGHGIRIFQGLKPQVAMVQEFKYGDNTGKALRKMVATAFGGRFYHVVQPYTSNGTIPNGVVSYYPIKDWGMVVDSYVNLTRKHVWARLDIPGPRDLWVVSVHFPTTGTSRMESIPELVAAMDALGIPEGDFVAIGGDYNTSGREDAGLVLLDDTGLVVLDTDDDAPIDQSDNGGTNATRGKPYDAIYTSQNLKDLRVQVDIPGAEGLTERGLVFDSRVFTPLSAVPPVREDDSRSENMQHMAVVKDYAIER